MTDHPITPPPELVDKWLEQCLTSRELATQAAHWGADQELEACCEWLKTKEWIYPEFRDELRDFRRPKPPSLQEQALEALEQIEEDVISNMRAYKIYDDLVQHAYTIRRALKQHYD